MQSFFSVPDTLANLQHQVLLQAAAAAPNEAAGSTAGTACDGIPAAALAAAASSPSSSRMGAALRLKSLSPSMLQQQRSMLGRARGVAVVLVLLAGAVGMWLAAAKERPLLHGGHHVHGSCGVLV
jgi:hypothetical protein